MGVRGSRELTPWLEELVNAAKVNIAKSTLWNSLILMLTVYDVNLQSMTGCLTAYPDLVQYNVSLL